jgi:hypothetical protein
MAPMADQDNSTSGMIAAPIAATMAPMADQDNSTSGMIALIPADPTLLAVPDGDPPDELHLTLAYLGDQVNTWTVDQVNALRERCIALANPPAPPEGEKEFYARGPIGADVWAHAVFNPTGGPDGTMTPAVVYLLKNARPDPEPGMESSPPYPHSLDHVASSALFMARNELGEALIPARDFTFEPHVTAGYAPDLTDTSALTYAGPIVFDRLRLELGDSFEDFPMLPDPPPRATGMIKSEQPPPTTVTISAQELADAGITVPEVKRTISPDKRDALRQSGHTLDKTSTSYPIENIGDLRNAVAAFGRSKPAARAMLARHLVSEAARLKVPTMVPDSIRKLAGGKEKKDETDPVGEVKFQSPDPRARKLAKYWARDPKGRAKWQPGTPGDFERLVTALREEVDPGMTDRVLKGLAANIHKMATGEWPGKNAHKGKKVGMKSLTDTASDTDILSALDGYSTLADNDGISTEDAYLYGLDHDINWSLNPDGTLKDDGADDNAGDTSGGGDFELFADDPADGEPPIEDDADLAKRVGYGN